MSINISPININEMNVNNIIYMNKKIKNEHKKIIEIGYANDHNIQQFVITLPTITLLSNIIEFEKYFILELPIYNENQTKIKKIIKKLKEIDDKIIEDAKIYSSEWFSESPSAKYKSIIRKSSNEDKRYQNGVLKLKILNPEFCKNDSLKTLIIKNIKTKGTIEDLKLNNDCKIIILLHSLVFNDNCFSICLIPRLISITTKIVMVNVLPEQLENSDDDNDDNLLDTETDEYVTELENKQKFNELELQSTITENIENSNSNSDSLSSLNSKENVQIKITESEINKTTNEEMDTHRKYNFNFISNQM